ncbi:MAG: sodium-translocating pyrophosphatase [Dehalococcoidales bacterium]|jgi:K(+)-stimulated pyrophosphate-energized sodium pump|nr:sodium-translocating pyrophosphatase [Dehalococcoidales bacterium]
MPGIFWLVPAACAITVIFAIWLIISTLKRSTGTPEMKKVGDMIYEGAWAFLKRQYSTIGMISIIVAIIIAVIVGVLHGEKGLNINDTSVTITAFGFAWRTGLAFLVGAVCSGIAGFIGMIIAVKSNVRCAAASQRSLNEAVQTAMRGAAVPGFLIVVLSLIGVTIIFFAFGGASHPAVAPHLILGFGFGASFVALFAQLGGGIYTKAADMGADLVGKVEAGIPEDDPRNAAVIADLVGDNVGDCAGRGADLFESTAAENIGAMVLGIALYITTNQIGWILFPLVVRSFGLIACMIGLLAVRIRGDENPMNALNRGYYVSVIISAIGMVLTVWAMLGSAPGGWGWLAGAGLIGILTSVVVVFVTQYYTEGRYRPVRSIVEASKTGPATNIVTGVSVGFESTVLTAIIIGVALLASYYLGTRALVGAEHLTPMASGAFGTAIATMGMLMTCAFILTEDTFGPITDNANGINEFAHAGSEVRRITDRLDAVGNTTKALTKGYAMVSAGLAAFLLFQAYLERVAILREIPFFENVNLAKPDVFVGALLAAMLVYFFCSLAIRAVSKTASKIIEEVRRQFRENPGIMKGTARPDYARAVDITARAALRGMIAPGLLPVLAPIVIGVVFNAIPLAAGYDAAMVVASVLMVGTIGGILMASFMNNGGGAWDNAKKFIEDNQLKDESGKILGKGSPAHAAAVVGDTVGDPFKDTAGPSVHVLVKLLATITLVMAPLFI